MTFARKPYTRTRVLPSPIPLAQRRNASMTPVRVDDFQASSPKENATQHARYMAAVRLLPCAHCGIAGPSQFCHSDEGKGMGIKSDCRQGWPGCAHCHDMVGTQRIYDKATRRRVEADMAAQTRRQITAMGLWPADLPQPKE